MQNNKSVRICKVVKIIIITKQYLLARFVIEPFLPLDGVRVPSGVSLRSTCIVLGRGRPLCILFRNLGGPPVVWLLIVFNEFRSSLSIVFP